MEKGYYDKEDLNQILDRNIAWIENCDSKASIILGAVGVVLAILLSIEVGDLYKNLYGCMTFTDWLFLIMLVIAFVICIIGIVFLLKSLTAKIDIKEFSKGGVFTDSRIFFSAIARNASFVEYSNKLKETDENIVLEDLKSQIYICAVICDAKFRNYNRGLFYSMSGLGILVISTIIRFIMG